MNVQAYLTYQAFYYTIKEKLENVRYIRYKADFRDVKYYIGIYERISLKMLDTYRYKVDFQGVRYYIEIHEVLKRDLNLPDYYGGNTDALWDCLTDMLGDPSYIEIYGFENVEKQYKSEWDSIIRTFKDAKHAYENKYADKFIVRLIHKNGKVEEII